MINLGAAASLLSSANPFSWLQTLYTWLGIAATFLLIGFYGGCEYKQNQWDAAKFQQMEKAKKQESKDQIAGTKTVTEFKQFEKEAKTTKDYVKGNIKGKPLVKIIGEEKKECGKNVEVISQPETKVTNSGVYLTAHFQRMHDLSARPGNSELRTRTYAEEHTVEIDEGFALIAENYAICVQDQKRLDTLIDRINQKKQIFKE